MSISYYDLAQDGEKFLSPHFQIKEFADPSDYERVPFPTTIPIHDKLPEILEKIYNNFGCTRGSINSGYRSPEADISVGGSGGGPHTAGIAVDVYFYRGSEPIPSRLVACFLKDLGIKGIGLNCGGNSYGTHFDMRHFDSGAWDDVNIWYGDEAIRDDDGNYGVVDEGNYYAYTGTTKAEVYPSGNSSSTSASSTNSSAISSDISSFTASKEVMTTSQNMIDIIKTQEGLSLKACKAIPSEEYWTIGYGHYGAEVKANQTISEAEAETLLKSDLKVFENAVNAAVKVNITQAQFDACVSLAYNIGTGAFANSDIVSFINAGKIGHACVDFPSWRLSGGQILIGLQKRRQIEMEFFGLGEDFTLNDTMNIRSGPGTENSIRKVSQITANGRECVVDKTANSNAMFKPGTVVTALELKAIYTTASIDVWLRCPSGWICARQNKDVFIK